MKKKPVKHPTMPLYIIKVGRGFKNTKTGQWLSDKEIQQYSNQEPKTRQKQEVKQSLSHSDIIERRWDLRNDY